MIKILQRIKLNELQDNADLKRIGTQQKHNFEIIAFESSLVSILRIIMIRITMY